MTTFLSLADRPTITAFVSGQSSAISRLNQMVEHIAQTEIPVLLFGESGCGKEVYGQLIHRLSRNCEKPLKKINCRTLDSGEFHAQLKTELDRSLEGPGTLFLDGIDELDLTGQKLLISALPDGDNHGKSSTAARLIASTCRDLEKEADSGRFRRDLYFRINGVCLRLPALRERRQDIPLLVEYFLAKHAAELGRCAPTLDPQELETLLAYAWPGNIRELENLTRSIVLFGSARDVIGKIQDKGAEQALQNETQSLSLKVVAKAASRQAERDLISLALERTRWNRKRAARDLQISYKSLLYKIKQTGLDGKQKEAQLKEQR